MISDSVAPLLTVLLVSFGAERGLVLVDVFRDDKIINSSSDLLDVVSGWILVSRNLLLLKLKKEKDFGEILLVAANSI